MRATNVASFVTSTVHLALVVVPLAACPSPPSVTEDGADEEVTENLGDVEGPGTAEVASEAEVHPDGTSDEDPDIDVTVPACPPGAGGRPCDDGNPCTDDSCLEVGCVHLPNIAGCDDGDPCTELDRCTGGVCVGPPLDCDDGERCTADTCAVGRCLHDAVSGPCDDASACTVGDRCDGGRCVGSEVTCPGGGPCRTAVCEPRTGCGFEEIVGACDDGDACTRDTVCVEGVCRGALASCDDGDPCTDDYCDPRLGCDHRFNRAPCDDLDRCTVDDRCADGVCLGALAGTCCPDDAACDDGDPCTDDRCEGPTCTHAPRSCDDGDACTRDACREGACASIVWADLPEGGHVVADFEGDLTGWTLTSSNNLVSWRSDVRWAAAGTASLYCGDAEGSGYDHGVTRATASFLLEVPPVEPILHLVVKSAVGDLGSCVYDALAVHVDGTEVGRVCGSGEGEHALSLAAFAGREALLTLVFDTIDDHDNSGLGVWVDRVRITAGPCR